MAVYLGEGIRPALSVFGVIFFASLLWAGYLNDQRLPYYAISVIAPSLLCLWHIWTFDHNDPKDCWKTFAVGLTNLVTWTNADIMLYLGGSPLRGDGLHWIDRGSLLQTSVPRRLSATLRHEGFSVATKYYVILILSSKVIDRRRKTYLGNRVAMPLFV